MRAITYAELDRSADLYRAVVASADENVIATDLDGRILLVNPAAERTLGVQAAECLGASVVDFVAPDHQDRVRRALADKVSGRAETTTYEIEVVATNGARIPLEVSSQLLRVQGEAVGVLAIGRNISERRQAEAALRESSERFRSVVESLSELVTILGHDGTILYESPAAERAIGSRPTERLGASVFQLVHPDDRYGLRSQLEELLDRPGGSRRGVFRLRHRDGSWRWFETVAQNLLAVPGVDGILLVSRDVTEQRELQHRLERSEERFRLFAEHARDTIIRYRLEPERGFEYVSPSCFELTGYTPEEHYADPDLPFRMVHPDDRKRVQLPTSPTAFRGPFTVRWIRKDRRQIWTEQHFTPIVDEHGGLVGFEGIIRDVTKRMEEQALLARYKILLEQSRDLIFVIGRDRRILDVNEEVVRTYGYAREDLLGLEVAKLRTPEERGKLAAQLHRADETGATYETVHRRRDGSTFPIEINARGIDLQGERVLVAIARDLSERKAAEERLRESEEQLRSIVRVLAEGIVVLERDGTISMTNGSAGRILGLAEGELRGRTLGDLARQVVRPDGTRCPLTELPTVVTLETGEPQQDVVLGFRRADGALCWLSVNTQPLAVDGGGRPSAVVVSFSDVTHEFEAVRELRRSEERFRTAFEHAAIGMALVGLDGRFLRVNDSLCAIVGYRADELLRVNFQDITHPDDLDADLEQLELCLAGEVRAFQMEKRYLRKDQSIVWIRLSASLVRDEDGTPLHFISQLEDIDARKRAERERNHLLAELEQRNADLVLADRRKDELVSIVSHDLRTPLTSIIGYLDSVLDGDVGAMNDEQRRFLGIARRNADRLLRLVNDLLLVSRAAAGRLELDLEPVDLGSLVEETVDAVAPRAEKAGVALAIVPSRTPAVVAGDYARIAEVLENLLTNAVKFTPAGGSITVRTARTSGGAVLEVVDTGIGIAKEEQRHLFEQFFRASTATGQAIEGAGLGLSIVKAIVEAHRGAIEVESDLGAGATFRVRLPAEPRPR